MPYRSVDRLPESVRHVLPKAAQEIYMKAFNAAYKEYDDETVVHKVAWSAVKKKFHRSDTGKWVKN